jgi:hypothetical protein
MFEIDEIQKTVDKELDASPSGAYAAFVKLSGKWAIKLFSSKGKRDETYEIQNKCHDIGYGPETLGTVDLSSEQVCNGRVYRYGYITEIIEPAMKMGGGSPWSWADKNREKLDPIVEKIREETGWNFQDRHGYNWGYKDDKLMPLDFGKN